MAERWVRPAPWLLLLLYSHSLSVFSDSLSRALGLTHSHESLWTVVVRVTAGLPTLARLVSCRLSSPTPMDGSCFLSFLKADTHHVTLV